MKYNPTMHKLSNGVTVILDPMDAVTTYAIVGFKTGSRDEKPSEYGLTHFCEHMLCKGTKRFPTAQSIRDYIYDNAGSINAATGDKDIQLYGTILAENVEILLDVFSDQLQNSVFDTDVIERERTIIADELRRALDGSARRNKEFIIKNIINGNYSVYRTLGSFENIASFTRNQMKMFMARRMTARNCVICVSGKIDNPEQLLASIEQKFSWMSPIDVAHDTPAPTYKPAVAHMLQTDKTNTDLLVLTPRLYECNAENKFKRMCVSRFDNYLKTELLRVLRTENGLVYGVDAESFTTDGFGINGFSAQTAPEKIGRMVELMAKTARDVCTTKPITDDFLARYNNRCRLGNAMWLESPARRCKSLFSKYIDIGELYDFNAAIQMASEITAQDVITNAQGYFNRPVSIISIGAKFDVDVMKIWHENFDNATNMQTIMLSNNNTHH